MLTRITETVSLDVTLVESMSYNEECKKIIINLSNGRDCPLYDYTVDEYNIILKTINDALLAKKSSDLYNLYNKLPV